MGRVLVTIDDLKALSDLLAQRDPAAKKPTIEFAGGSIDTPADMRELSDTELSRLTIKTDDVEVVLAADEAYCLGAEEISEIIYTNWARSRPAKLPPKNSRRFWRSKFDRIFLFILPIMIIPPILATISFAKNQEPEDFDAFIVNAVGKVPPAIFMATLSAATPVYMVWMILRPSKNFAEIRPVTLEEYRKDGVARGRQLVTWLIAVSAVAATLLGVVLTLIFKK